MILKGLKALIHLHKLCEIEIWLLGKTSEFSGNADVVSSPAIRRDTLTTEDTGYVRIYND